MENTHKKQVHVGQNIQRLRNLRGYSQAGLAHKLEEIRNKPTSQQLISDIEDREVIADEELLKHIAQALEVSPEALSNTDFNSAINVIVNSTYDYSTGSQINYNPVFNPLEKLIELFEKEKAELRAEIEKLKNNQK